MIHNTLARSTALCLCTLALSFGADNAQALSLNDALATSYENNPNLKSGQEELHATNESLFQAYSGWLPDISASYTKSRENETRGSGAEENLKPINKSLTIRQQIFNGGETLARTRRAENQIKAARERLQRIEQQTLGLTVSTYMDVVRAKEVLALSINNEKVLAEQLEASRQRFELGESTKTDVAQSESRLARGESDRIDAEGRLIAAKAEFRRALGTTIPDDKVILPKKRPVLPKTRKEALDMAFKYNPALREAEYSAAVSKADVATSKAALFPDVSVNGRITRDKGLSSISGTSFDEESVGFTVSIPLYQSGSEYSRIRQAKRNAAGARQDISEARNAVEEDVTKAWEDIQTSQAIIKSQTASVNAAKVALEGVREERDVGSRTTLDVLDAEQELFQAQVNLVGAERDEIIAIYSLLSTVGQLTAESLKLDVDMYDADRELKKVKYKFIGY